MEDIGGEQDRDGYEIANGVSIMRTAGHWAECASLIVETDDKGPVVFGARPPSADL